MAGNQDRRAKAAHNATLVPDVAFDTSHHRVEWKRVRLDGTPMVEMRVLKTYGRDDLLDATVFFDAAQQAELAAYLTKGTRNG